MGDKYEDILDSSAAPPQSSKMTSSSSTQRQFSVNGGDDPKLQKTPTSVANEETSDPPPRKANWLVAWIRNQIKTFNPLLLLMAIKGALPPIIFMSMYRATPVAVDIGSLGYLVAIISSLSFAMQPRAKFLQSLFRNIVFTCIAVPFTILGLWCARQAKLHTEPAGSTARYNSSAAAVCAIFLFVNNFAINAFRARYPKLMLSVVMYSIQTNVCFTLGFILPESLPVYYLPKRLLINFLLAFGLALGVNLVIIPVNSRTVFLRSFLAYLNSVSGLLKAHNEYLIPPENFLTPKHEKALAQSKEVFRTAFVKMVTDKADAKREFAFGALSRDNISDLFKFARKIAWPLLGVGTIATITGEIMRSADIDPETTAEKTFVQNADILKALQVLERPCGDLNALCKEAIDHILCTLKLGKYAPPSIFARLFKKKSSTPTDNETAQDLGTNAFITRFDAGLDRFKGQRGVNLAQFYDEKQTRPTQGLFLVLSVEFLLFAVAQEIRSLVVFVDDLRNDGSLTRKRLVYPRWKTFQKALERIFHSRGTEDVVEEGYGAEEGDVFTPNYTGRKNQTSHVPATNNRFLRGIVAMFVASSHFFRSEFAQFGIRAALATLAGTIPAFLAQSYNFFTMYRGVWITITVVLGMSPTTGASISGLAWRCVGTVVGGLCAMAVWYIVVGHVPGVIVFSLVVTSIHFYFFLQDPRRIRAILNSFTTFLLIIGYALEVTKIGIATIESTGQKYIPLYELAPFRILVTLIGVVLAFIFTVFPFPVTSRDILRRDVARQFHLLSNIFALSRSRLTIAVMTDGTKDSAGLRKVLGKEAFKCIAVQARCMENLEYTSWEPSLQYKFPQKTYAELLSSLQSLFELFVIQNDAASRLSGHWLQAISLSLGTEFFQSQSHLTLSVLNLLSGSLALDSPLPPFLRSPKAVSFRVLVQEEMPEELSLGHVEENGYAVFAALAVSMRLASREVERCVQLVKSLVGEVDLKWNMEDLKKDA